MAGNGGAHLQSLADQLAEELGAPVRRWIDGLVEGGAPIPASLAESEAAGILVRMVACSEYAAAALARDWSWFCAAIADGSLGRPLESSPLSTAIEAIGGDEPAPGDVASALRTARNRGLLHILWRITAATDSVWGSLASLSALADALIAAAMTQVGS